MKWVAAFVLGIAGLVLMIGFAIPSHWQASASTEIAAPVSSVYPLVVDLKRWQEWTEWNAQNDPGVKWRYEGTAGQPGASMDWKGQQLGAGQIELTAVDPNRSVSFRIEFQGHQPSKGTITLAPSGNGTHVAWSMEGDAGANPLMHLYLPRIKADLTEQLGEDLGRLASLATGKK